jgi:hypothetical protein
VTALDEALHWRQLLVKAIEEKGEDYVYEDPIDWSVVPENDRWKECKYLQHETAYATATQVGDKTGYVDVQVFIEGKVTGPACLVGHAWYYDGRPVEALVAAEGTSAKMLLDDLDEDVAYAVDLAQSSQDRGETWGEALAVYDKRCNKIIPGYKDAVK